MTVKFAMLIFTRIPWENELDGLMQTDDEDIFQALARSFADSLPSMYKPETCNKDLPHGIKHGSQLKGDSNAVLMDEVYNKYHSLMVRQLFLTFG
jgi:hypothetical protein